MAWAPQALPILAAGIVALALLSIGCSIVTASGRPDIAIVLVALTLAVGSAAAFAIVPAATPRTGHAARRRGGDRARHARPAWWRRSSICGAVSPPGRRSPSVLRVGLAAAVAVGLGRLLPGAGKLAGLAAIAVSAIAFAAVLLLAREFGPTDREKFAKILRLKKSA